MCGCGGGGGAWWENGSSLASAHTLRLAQPSARQHPSLNTHTHTHTHTPCCCYLQARQQVGVGRAPRPRQRRAQRQQRCHVRQVLGAHGAEHRQRVGGVDAAAREQLRGRCCCRARRRVGRACCGGSARWGGRLRPSMWQRKRSTWTVSAMLAGGGRTPQSACTGGRLGRVRTAHTGRQQQHTPVPA
jgi:hypothetical protein